MQIWLDRAGPADRELLYRLLQYSLYEESAHDGNVMGPDGLFEYPWFDLYFTPPFPSWQPPFSGRGKFFLVNTGRKHGGPAKFPFTSRRDCDRLIYSMFRLQGRMEH